MNLNGNDLRNRPNNLELKKIIKVTYYSHYNVNSCDVNCNKWSAIFS